MPIAFVFALTILMPYLVLICRRHTSELDSNFLGWFFLLLCSFQTLAITPYLLYLSRFYRDWGIFYLVNPEQFPILETQSLAISGIIVVIGYFLMILSYGYTRLTLRSRHMFAVHWPLFITLGASGAAGYFFQERLMRVANYSSFWDGSGVIFYLHPVCWSFGAVILAAIFTLLLSLKIK